MSLLLWDILQEHLDEAAFLYTQWERARGSPHRALRDVAWGVEERLLAHADGLVVGGPPAMERLLLPALGDDSADPEVTWAAAFALLEGGLEGAAEAVLKALGEAGEAPERLAALGRAVELSSAPLEEKLRPLLQSESAPVVAAALRALASKGVFPEADRLDDFIASESPELSAAALDLAWGEPTLHRRELLERALASASAPVREAALGAGLRMRLRAAWEACLKAESGLALAALAMGGSEKQLAQVEALLADEARRADALFALGLSGRLRAVDACLPWLSDKKVGHLAGEVLTAVTGVAIEGPLRAEAEEEPDEEEEPEEEDLDAELDPGPVGELPRPNPEAVKALWEKRRGKLRDDARLLGGEPITAGGLRAALRDGPMRRRPMLALELSVRSQSAPADLSRWARRQLADASSGFRHFEERPFEAFFS